MASYDLFLFEGHGEGDPGACSNGRQEHTEAKRLNDKVIEYLKSTGLNIHRNNGKNNFNNCLLVGNTYKYKFGFTTHLNSASATATGIEALVQSKESYLSVEQNIINRIAATTGLANRGMKSKDYVSDRVEARVNGKVGSYATDWYKELRDARAQGICLSILEICFISNSNDMKLFDKYFNDIAFIIADEIAKYCGKSISKTPVNTTPPQNAPQGSTGASNSTGTSIYRVIADGSQVGAYGVIDNAIAEIKKQLLKGAKIVEINKK